MTRVKHHWDVTLQREDGPVEKREVAAYWDPERIETSEDVGIAARIEAHMAGGKRHQFQTISVTNID